MFVWGLCHQELNLMQIKAGGNHKHILICFVMVTDGDWSCFWSSGLLLLRGCNIFTDSDKLASSTRRFSASKPILSSWEALKALDLQLWVNCVMRMRIVWSLVWSSWMHRSIIAEDLVLINCWSALNRPLSALAGIQGTGSAAGLQWYLCRAMQQFVGKFAK